MNSIWFLLKVALDILGPLHFPIHFIINILIATKKSLVGLWLWYREIYRLLGGIESLITLRLSLTECDIYLLYLHSFKSQNFSGEHLQNGRVRTCENPLVHKIRTLAKMCKKSTFFWELWKLAKGLKTVIHKNTRILVPSANFVVL